jgi:hypothetical protein
MLISGQTPPQPPLPSIRHGGWATSPHFRRYGGGARHGWGERRLVPFRDGELDFCYYRGIVRLCS